ncbi:putative Pyridine nucleotide-disulfide oxidoreductase domain-containing protein 1 [Nannochloris sp. 'desiccata']|nr:putative Pyridine nucleotide-disulfide oxidoreductase domain-containing protein 1 [Chlorella desiccata (nom. nud.)]
MVNYVIIGGGIAGVCCAEELCRTCPNDSVTLVAATRILKGVSTVAQITKTIEELQVVEKDLDSLPYPNLNWVQGIATDIDTEKQLITILSTDDDNEKIDEIASDLQISSLPYDKVCICTGAKPRRLLNSPHVVVLRDTDSVQELSDKLKSAKKVMVVGNGGIALELAHALHGVDVTWVIRHGHIGDAFFDLDAAQFLLEELQHARKGTSVQKSKTTTTTTIDDEEDDDFQAQIPPTQIVKMEGRRNRALGHAVGPAWTRALSTNSNQKEGGGNGGAFSVEMGCEVIKIAATFSPSSSSPSNTTNTAALEVSLSDGRTLGTDVIVSVIGVDPAVDWVPACVSRSVSDHGLVVDSTMKTSVENVYAAGDACSMIDHSSVDGGGNEESSCLSRRHWFQMRLWSQARAQAIYAAHCMSGISDQTGSDMSFEVFTHVTRFLGKKVVLLGLYNGQKLEDEPESDLVSYSRVTEEGDAGHHRGHCCRPGYKSDDHDKGRTFVRILLLRGKVQGAVLIGETDLEEAMENLILDGLDVDGYGPDLLDPEIDLEAIFD